MKILSILIIGILGFMTTCVKGEISIPEELKSTSAIEFNQKGFSFHKEKNYEESYKYFAYSTAKDNTFYLGYFNQACALSKLNKTDDAIDALQKAAELNAKWVNSQLNDPDLNNINKTDQFNVLRSTLPGMITEQTNAGSYTGFIGKSLNCQNDSCKGDMNITLYDKGNIKGGTDTCGPTRNSSCYATGWSRSNEKLLISMRCNVRTMNSPMPDQETTWSTESFTTVKTFNSPEDLKNSFTSNSCSVGSTF